MQRKEDIEAEIVREDTAIYIFSRLWLCSSGCSQRRPFFREFPSFHLRLAMPEHHSPCEGRTADTAHSTVRRQTPRLLTRKASLEGI